MRTTIEILQKIFTQRFYIQNTGFFLVLFYLLFGVVDGGNLISYHTSLMLGFLGSYTFLLIVLLLWGLYGLKCVGFILKTFQLQGYEFLYPTMGSIDKPMRRRIWLLLHTAIYMPVLVYAGIAAGVGIVHGHYLPVAMIVVFNVVMCIWPLLLYERKLHQPDVLFFTGHLQRWLNKHFTKPPLLFFLYELFTNYPRRIFSVKLFSAGVLWLTFFLLAQMDFDIRGLQLGIILSVLLHMQLMLHHRSFDDTYLNFVQQLPVPLWRHYIRVTGIYALLYLPEMVMIVVNAYGKTSLPGLLTCFVVAVSLLVLFRCLLYFSKIDAEIHLRYVLLISFVVLFMILGKYEWPAVLLLQAAAAIVFLAKYRTYEPLPKMGS
ncbi:hypothetical protein [Chitinophaga niabensis]|uniref:Uncharacterized protein n=1 Tax=Chitinophaga niabensis TaxID=536979 RepID=A0A1N6G2A9_9BACT|nr:hypothetical protein [Chitinophaga niabensis]SIO01654.1 hypothetical protein SAMN04488055_2539 [Chitinophaga niabensis]